MRQKSFRAILFLTVFFLLIVIVFIVPISHSTDKPQSLAGKIVEVATRVDDAVRPRRVSLILGGDVMVGRTVMITALERGSVTYPFEKIASTLSSADITFVNLENPLVAGCLPDLTRVSLVFCATPEFTEALTFAGVDIVNLANNHSLNYGISGLEETKEHLAGAGIRYVGSDRLEVIEVERTKFGFLGFDRSQQIKPELTLEERALISESAEKVDVLVVAMHWGVEYQAEPLDGVVALARELSSLGVDVIVGHHPHWVQTVGEVNGTKVYYSLGNLVFDQMQSIETRSGLLAKLTFENGELVEEELIKTFMEEWARPEVVR